MTEKPVEHQYVIPGTMVRHDDDDWCENCLKPSKQKGVLYLITDLGSTIHGMIEGCFECQLWKAFDLKGTFLKNINWRKNKDD